jgi:hypothetical protein
MASPGKKPRLEAAVTPANPKAVILINGKPTRLIVSRPKQLLAKDGDSSGTSATKAIGPIILVRPFVCFELKFNTSVCPN